MLDYAVKLTRQPSAMEEADVVKLRDAGWEDPEILDICALAAYRNFISRVMDGLGVELDAVYDALPHEYREGLRGSH